MLSRTGEIEVVGRADELAAVTAFLVALDRLPAGFVIEGEAGIGKTTLWRGGIVSALALGYRVLSTRPAQAESQVSYAGLADLLEPVLEDALRELPPPQRRALELALLLREAGGEAPDQAAIAFAFLGALRVAAREQPVLVAVDDFQWLDAPSSFALRFASRRLRAEPVGLLFAVRVERGNEASPDVGRFLREEQLDRIEVGPLSLGALQLLIQSRLELVLPRPLLQRLHQESGGNPFFAIELARALKDQADQLDPGEPLPVTGELRGVLRARLAALSEDAKEALLVVAAVPRPTIELVAKAVRRDPRGALRSGVETGLLELDGSRIRFTHPLFGSAVYLEAEIGRRREIHARLAGVAANVEERARHLALSTEGEDASVALVLDEAAEAARARGAPQSAAELSELALRLTPPRDVERAHRRRLDAGDAHFEAGDTARARAHFVEAAEHAGHGQPRAEALARLARLHHYAGDQRLAVELFRECLADPGADVSVRIDAAEGLATSLFFLREELAEALNQARSAARLAAKERMPGADAVALGTQGVLEAVLGLPKAMRTLDAAVAREDSAHHVPLARRPSFQRAFTGVWSDDVDAARAELEGVRRQALARGDESSLPFVLTYVSLADCLSGRWEDALRAADEGEAAALAAGQQIGRAFALSARALVSSCLGREDSARSDADEALALAERGTMLATMTSSWALGLLELALDDPAEAHRRLGPLVERVQRAGIGEPGSIRFVTDDVEALAALGQLEEAMARLEPYEELARRLDRRSALAAAGRSRGLIALAAGATDEALEELGRALAVFEGLPLPFEHARTLLVLGAAQRRARHRRAARETLEAARGAFEALGASLWSQRAEAEVRRVSGRAPAGEQLTPAERRVAELVAEGRTNKEVAVALHLTERTVEGTLSRVYAKLRVRSRSELAHRWAAGT